MCVCVDNQEPKTNGGLHVTMKIVFDKHIVEYLQLFQGGDCVV